MKRKLLSILLSLSMLLAMLPFSALALEAGAAEAEANSEAPAGDEQPGASGASAASFRDISGDYIFAEDISFAASKGWMGGYGDETFRPGANASRQTLWMALARVDGADPAGVEDAKAWAKANGITDGTRAVQGMSRQQMVTMLYRYAQLKGYDTTGGADISGYPDAELVSAYAKEPLAWAIGNGIVNGASDGKLNPIGTASRAHLAAFLHRFANTMGL